MFEESRNMRRHAGKTAAQLEREKRVIQALPKCFENSGHDYRQLTQSLSRIQLEIDRNISQLRSEQRSLANYRTSLLDTQERIMQTQAAFDHNTQEQHRLSSIYMNYMQLQYEVTINGSSRASNQLLYLRETHGDIREKLHNTATILSSLQEEIDRISKSLESLEDAISNISSKIATLYSSITALENDRTYYLRKLHLCTNNYNLLNITDLGESIHTNSEGHRVPYTVWRLQVQHLMYATKQVKLTNEIMPYLVYSSGDDLIIFKQRQIQDVEFVKSLDQGNTNRKLGWVITKWPAGSFSIMKQSAERDEIRLLFLTAIGVYNK